MGSLKTAEEYYYRQDGYGNCLETCKLMHIGIGSVSCQEDCDHLIKFNNEKKYIKCEFLQILTEDRQQIKDMIDEMIEKYKKESDHWKEQYNNKGDDSLFILIVRANTKISLLTEIKEKL